ncbi:MAG TPA: GNAT family N-acetyltransferase [Steroidobacteraceae bacterium]|nr:GNAT family N-acetyltransferase [Steroidobacteraceae bacterium]
MFDPATYQVAETLSDGRKVEIRALRRDDRDALLAAAMRCTTKTLYHRFFTVVRSFSERDEHFFLEVDFVKHVALAAVASEGGRPSIVGSCRYVVVAPGRGELGFLVIDDYQRKGLGAALLRCLATIGRQAGLREFVAQVLAENIPMLKVFERCGLPMTERREGPVVDVTLRLD